MASTKRETTCPVCEGRKVEVFLEIPSVPVFCNVLFASREQAVNAPCGRVDLGFCPDCEHVFNVSFDPRLLDYNVEYENSLHFSAHFDHYARSTAKRLIDDYDLDGKTIVEIGSGQGDFLRMLCDGGRNRGVGFDPSYRNEEGATEEYLRFVPDLYSEKYRDTEGDLYCCRHVLEHIDEPRAFLRSLRETIGARSSALFFEVPNALFILEGLSVWDIIYEHVSFFTPRSLHHAFSAQGFAVRKVEPQFHEQYLCIEATTAAVAEAGGAAGRSAGLAQVTREFSRTYAQKVAEWEAKLGERKTRGHRGAVWGAGSKGVMFANTLENRQPIEFLVDINPRKKGKFVPVGGQPVVAPESLKATGLDFVILMNPAYKREIEDQLAALGVRCEVLCV